MLLGLLGPLLAALVGWELYGRAYAAGYAAGHEQGVLDGEAAAAEVDLVEPPTEFKIMLPSFPNCANMEPWTQT